MSDRPVLLTVSEAAGLLQRAMHGRDATAWLEADRRFAPILPPVRRNCETFYLETDCLALARKLDPGFIPRQNQTRRLFGERRLHSQDRRQGGERRARRSAAQKLLDRRLALRPDRRSDLDRRIRGWVDRRCIHDRRRRGEAC